MKNTNVHSAAMVSKIIDGYFNLIRPHVEKEGWSAFLLTFTFKPLRGSMASVISQMHDEVDRVYSTFITRVVRNPNSKHQMDRRPILIAAPDLPVHKRKKQKLHHVTINDGLHMHGVMVVPWNCRLRRGAKDQIEKDKELYVTNRLLSLDVRGIDHDLAAVVDYALKGLKRSDLSYDDVLVLPRSASEKGSKAYKDDPVSDKNSGYVGDLSGTKTTESVIG